MIFVSIWSAETPPRPSKASLLYSTMTSICKEASPVVGGRGQTGPLRSASTMFFWGDYFNPFSIAVPIRVQTSLIPSDLSPKRDWGPKRVNSTPHSVFFVLLAVYCSLVFTVRVRFRFRRVCVLHIKPFFLPVDIRHNQCPCRFFNPRRDTSSSGHKATPMRYFVATYWYAVSTTAVGNATPCHYTITGDHSK